MIQQVPYGLAAIECLRCCPSSIYRYKQFTCNNPPPTTISSPAGSLTAQTYTLQWNCELSQQQQQHNQRCHHTGDGLELTRECTSVDRLTRTSAAACVAHEESSPPKRWRFIWPLPSFNTCTSFARGRFALRSCVHGVIELNTANENNPYIQASPWFTLPVAGQVCKQFYFDRILADCVRHKDMQINVKR